MTRLSVFSLLILLTFPAVADPLPGFRVETVARLDGFVSSVVTDSQGTIYATTTDGWIHRLAGSQAERLVRLPTRAGGNSGLLGMALVDNNTAVVHYTLWGTETLVYDDIISRVDLTTGKETVLATFVCDIEVRTRGASPEHHGGNPVIGPEGAIFVGIGEYGGHTIAQLPEWNGGKVWRIEPDGSATQWARGLRNPFDLAWDPVLSRVVVSDNGPQRGDEIHVIGQGSNCGWPLTYGDQPPVDGAVAPDYVFPNTVAPTGLLRLDGSNALLRTGYLVSAFVTSSLYYFPSLAAKPVPDPIPILDGFDEPIIDVTQSPAGELFIASASFPATSTISRLQVPSRGDCNGDGVANRSDEAALMTELGDGESRTIDAQSGAYAGSWGCDANADGMITAGDLDALRRIVYPKRRAVGKG